MNHRISGILSMHKCLLLLIAFGWFWFVLLFWERLLDFKLVLSSQPWMYLICIIVAVATASMGTLQEYDNFFTLRHWRSFRKGIAISNLQLALIAFFVFSTYFATKDSHTSRSFLVALIASYFPILVISNFFIPIFLREFFLRDKRLNSTVIVGSSKALHKMKGWLANYERKGFDIKGVIIPSGDFNEDVGGFPKLGGTKNLSELLKNKVVQKVIIVPDRTTDVWLSEIVELCYRNGSRFLLYNPLPDIFDNPLIPLEESGGAFYTLQNEPLDSPVNRTMKRVFDLLISIPVVFLALPLTTVMVWFFQRMQSAGPVFFTQERVGAGGRHFTILKYRSMAHSEEDDDEQESVQAVKDDERVFPFGRFIRKFSMDELPQFVNVLRGDMSLVGPRPYMPCHDALFSKDFKAYKVRQFVKPGVTGPAQCRGLRGEVIDKESLNERIELDFHYVGNWSIWLDIEIVIKTFKQVLFPPETAY